MSIEKYLASRWKKGNLKEEKIKIDDLNSRYAIIFNYLNDSFKKGKINLNTLSVLKNYLVERYYRERCTIFIEEKFNRIFNNQLEKMAKSLR